MSEGSGRVTADDLARFVARVLERLGAPAADARSVAELMVEADLRGYDTHGVFRLRQYVDRLRAGGVNPRPRLGLVTETAATALLDGDKGLGHVALRHATELAIGKADAAGIGWVGVRHGKPCRPGRTLRAAADRARHDRTGRCGRQRQPRAALRRQRPAARHQPDRDRGAGRRAAPVRPRHGDHGRRGRQDQDARPARRADAGGLDGGAGRPPADRSDPLHPNLRRELATIADELAIAGLSP